MKLMPLACMGRQRLGAMEWRMMSSPHVHPLVSRSPPTIAIPRCRM